MRYPVRLLIVLLLVLSVSACGGNDQSLRDARQSGTISGSELLGQLDSLDAPVALKGALKQALDITPDAKFTVHPPQGPRSTVTDLTLAILPNGSSGIQWTYVNPGDYNFDGQVNLHDLANLGAFLGAAKGDDRWQTAQYVDGDGNGAVTIADITPIAVNFLGTVVAWQIEGATSENNTWQSVGQVANSSGISRGNLAPPFFVVSIPNGMEICRISPLDATGVASPDWSNSKNLTLAQNLVLLGEPGFPSFVERDGNLLTLDVTASDSVKPGDILYGTDWYGLLFRVEDVVSADADAKLVAECTPVPFGKLVPQGTIDIRTSPPENYQLSFPLSGIEISPAPGMTVKVIDGNLTYVPKGESLKACYSFGELAGAKVQATGDLTFHAKFEVSGSGQEFVGSSQDFVLTVPLEGYSAEPSLYPGSELTVPTVVYYEIQLGMEGSGAVNGKYELEYSANLNSIQTSFEFRPTEEYFPWQGTYICDPTVSASEPTAGPVGTQHRLQLFPYVRVSTKILPLHGMGLYHYGDPPDFTINNKLRFMSEFGNSSAPAGIAYYQDVTADAGLLAALGRFGIDENFEGFATAQNAEFIEPISTGLLPYSNTVTRTISGHAYDGSNPLSGVTVTVRNSGTSAVLGSDVTDGEGAYEVAELPDGASVQVSAELSGYSFQPPLYQFTLDSDKTADFTGAPLPVQTYGVSGYLTDFEMFTPIVGASVYLYDAGGINQLAQTETDGEGHYSFTGVNPFTTVRVVPAASGYDFAPTYAEFTVTGEMGQNFTGYLGGP